MLYRSLNANGCASRSLRVQHRSTPAAVGTSKKCRSLPTLLNPLRLACSHAAWPMQIIPANIAVPMPRSGFRRELDLPTRQWRESPRLLLLWREFMVEDTAARRQRGKAELSHFSRTCEVDIRFSNLNLKQRIDASTTNLLPHLGLHHAPLHSQICKQSSRFQTLDCVLLSSQDGLSINIYSSLYNPHPPCSP